MFYKTSSLAPTAAGISAGRGTGCGTAAVRERSGGGRGIAEHRRDAAVQMEITDLK